MVQCMLRRADFLQRRGDLQEFRFIKAMAAHANENVQTQGDLVTWLSEYKFTSASESGACGWAPIHFAALEGNLLILDALLGEGEEVDRVVTEMNLEMGSEAGMTPLMIASYYISETPVAIKVAQFLLSRGASLSGKTEMAGKQVIHYAAMGSAHMPGLCSFLLDHGAKMEDKCGFGMTPMHYTVYS